MSCRCTTRIWRQIHAAAGVGHVPNQVKSSDAILFITPEGQPRDAGWREERHRRWLSTAELRAWKAASPRSAFSLTPGKLGAMGAHQQLRLTLSVLGVPVMPAPETYLADAGKQFDGDGKLGERGHDQTPHRSMLQRLRDLDRSLHLDGNEARDARRHFFGSLIRQRRNDLTGIPELQVAASHT